MKSESNIKPKELSIESHGEISEIIFCENIKEIMRDDSKFYQYDEYRTIAKSRDNLLEAISTHKVEWLERAKQVKIPRPTEEDRISALESALLDMIMEE
jgi:hypothetical protein